MDEYTPFNDVLHENSNLDLEHDYTVKVIIGRDPSKFDKNLFRGKEALFRLVKIETTNDYLLDDVSFILKLNETGKPRITNMGVGRVRIFDEGKETLAYIGKHPKSDMFWDQFTPISTIDIVCANDFIFRFKVLECASMTKYVLFVNPTNTDKEDWVIRRGETFLDTVIN